MDLLITSDDGPQAPGLLALAQGLADHAPIVFASGTHLPSLGTALEVGGVATAAKLVRDHLAQAVALPDVVLVGINYGPNTGRGILHSGTFGAALSASACGVPSMAVSLDDVHSTGGVEDGPMHWESAVHVARQLLGCGDLWSNALLNVNVPNAPLREIRDVVFTTPEHWPSTDGLPSDVDTLREKAVSLSSFDVGAFAAGPRPGDLLQRVRSSRVI